MFSLPDWRSNKPLEYAASHELHARMHSQMSAHTHTHMHTYKHVHMHAVCACVCVHVCIMCMCVCYSTRLSIANLDGEILKIGGYSLYHGTFNGRVCC